MSIPETVTEFASQPAGSFEIEPIGPTIGARIHGLDLAQELDGREFAALEAAPVEKRGEERGPPDGPDEDHDDRIRHGDGVKRVTARERVVDGEHAAAVVEVVARETT